MTNFEKITTSPETLGAFLASLPIASGPWDENFHRTFCDSCERENCDEKRCPHEDKRNNPTWWLRLGEQSGEQPDLSIKDKMTLPIEFGKVYYTVNAKKEPVRAICTCCDNTGKVTIKGVEYNCPKCKGNWREREVVGKTTVYSVAKWMLESVFGKSSEEEITFCLKRIDGTGRNSSDVLNVKIADIRNTIIKSCEKTITIYEDHEDAMKDAELLNAMEREKQKGAGGDA